MASEAQYITFGTPLTTGYRTTDASGNLISGSLSIDAIRTLAPMDTAVIETYAVDGDPNSTRDDFSPIIDSLHPDIRSRAASAIAEIQSAGIALIAEPTAGYRTTDTQAAIDPRYTAAEPGTSFHNFGLAVDIVPANEADRDRVREIMQRYGFANDLDGRTVDGEPVYPTRMLEFRGEADVNHYQTSVDWRDAYAIRELPMIDVEGREYPLIPGGALWHELERTDPTRFNAARAEIEARFGAETLAEIGTTPSTDPIPVAATGAATAPAAGGTATPDSGAPAASATDSAPASDTSASAATPWQRIPNNTPAPAGTDKWTQNGLLGLGVVTESMTAEERNTAITNYLTGAGVTGSGENGAFTEADIVAQVRTDVIAWQTHLSAAPSGRDGDPVRYDIGTFRDASGAATGIDGKFGDMTLGATQAYAAATGIDSPLTVLRAASPSDQLAAAAAAAGAGLAGVTTDGQTHTSLPEGAAGEAMRTGQITPSSPQSAAI